MVEEVSQPGELPEDLPSMSPHPGKTSEFDILTLSIITDIIVMTVGDAAPTQEEERIMDVSAKDIPVVVSKEKVLTLESVIKAATQEVILVSNPEAPMAISEMRQLLT